MFYKWRKEIEISPTIRLAWEQILPLHVGNSQASFKQRYNPASAGSVSGMYLSHSPLVILGDSLHNCACISALTWRHRTLNERCARIQNHTEKETNEVSVLWIAVTILSPLLSKDLLHCTKRSCSNWSRGFIALDTVLSQLNPVHIITPYFSKIHFITEPTYASVFRWDIQAEILNISFISNMRDTCPEEWKKFK